MVDRSREKTLVREAAMSSDGGVRGREMERLPVEETSVKWSEVWIRFRP